MTRHVIIRRPDGSEESVPESILPAEANLHDVLTAHPELLPAEDLGLRRPIVVGRESSLASGYADLVLIDEIGQICLVEVKKEGNPDTRRVVAQLLDYAADLWGRDAQSLHSAVIRPFLQTIGADVAEIHEFLEGHFSDPPAVGDYKGLSVDAIVQSLSANLAEGDFMLVVAAPTIPPGVRRVLEYLTARGLRVFGLEVSYFAGPAECFVPRLVHQPTAAANRANAASRPDMMIDRESYLDSLPTHVVSPVSELLDESAEAGAEIEWRSYGVSIKVRRGRVVKQVAWLTRNSVGISTAPLRGFDEEPFARFREKVREMEIGRLSPHENWLTTEYAETDTEGLAALKNHLISLLSELAERIAFVSLDAPARVTFERNDHNVWRAAVPELERFAGRALSGRLSNLMTGSHAPVTLHPLRGGAPGWLPAFTTKTDELSVWPPGEYIGRYELEITHVAE